MRDRLWLLFGLLLGFSFAIQVALPVDLSEQPETSFETAPRGHAALFELLARFDAVRGRWLSGVSMPPVDETVWWIAASGICDRERGPIGERVALDAESAVFRHTVEPWIEAGGTAIVWLSHPPLEPEAPFERTPETSPADVETREVSFRRSVLDPDAPAGAAGDSEEESENPTRPPAPADGSAAESPADTREDWHESLDTTRREIREGEPRPCAGIAGWALPPRRLAGLEGGELPPDADYAASVFSVGRWVEAREAFEYAAARTLPGATLGFFDRRSPALAGWRPVWVEADDFTPFALERAVGAGHLIVVADARVLTNARLARVDSAPFVFDWVAQFGKPWIDEHGHGVVSESGTIRYLATSPAWAACVGILALGVLLVWRGHALPRRSVAEVDPDAPTLATFVDSLARLYAETGDHARAFERYRASTLDRVRRALGLAAGTPTEVVLASLQARAANRPTLRERGLRDLLTQDLRIESRAELERAVARLDDLVRSLLAANQGGGGFRRARNE